MSKGYIKSTETIIKDEYGVDRVKTTEKIFKHNAEGENFYMVFVNYVQWMYDLKGIVPIKVLHSLLEEASVNTGKVSLSTGKRQQIITKLGISRCAFYKAIAQLVEVNAISKVYYINKDTGEETESAGDFYINPEMLWKGDKNKRKELTVIFKATYSK